MRNWVSKIFLILKTFFNQERVPVYTQKKTLETTYIFLDFLFSDSSIYHQIFRAMTRGLTTCVWARHGKRWRSREKNAGRILQKRGESEKNLFFSFFLSLVAEFSFFFTCVLGYVFPNYITLI